MTDEIIDSRIVPGVLITLRQRMKYIPYATRSLPGFDIQNTNVPVWKTSRGDPGHAAPPASTYEFVPSGSLASVIRRYVERDVTRFEVLVSGKIYQCYGTHADLVE
jgi:hypothetical protein